METPTDIRQDYYTTTKISINQRRNENKTEHITNLKTEIALLKTNINIKINNLVKILLNELDELIIKITHDLHMS